MTFELKQIDRALEWAVRAVVVAAGYWPDTVALHLAGELTTERLEELLAGQVAAGRPVVEVFGPGGWQERGTLKGNNIIVTRLTVDDGTYATGCPVQEEPDPDHAGYFRRVRRPEGPQSITYDVRFVADDTTLDRLLTGFILAAFPRRGYQYGLLDDLQRTAEGFWVRRSSPQDLSGADFLERLWRLTVVDVYVEPDVVLETGIPAATDLSVELTPSVTPAAPEPGEGFTVQLVSLGQ